MRKRLLTMVLLMCCLTLSAAEKYSEAKAKEVFTTAYNHFFGKDGVRFNYAINILGIYKENGWACYKGDKSKSAHGNTVMWNDGTLLYKLRTNKNVVEIHDPKVNKEDQMLQKFKFYPDEFNYSMEDEGDCWLVKLKAKKDAKNTKMKEVRILVEPSTHHPRQLRIKIMSLFWAKISFTDFKSGNIADSNFIFPKEKYKNCTVEDHR